MDINDISTSLDLFQSATEPLYKICNPLRKLGIYHFSCLKNFDDGGQFNISTLEEWVRHYYESKLYEKSLFERKPDQYQDGYILWSSKNNNQAIDDGRKYFNSDYGITIIRRQSDGCAFYFFSTTPQNCDMFNFYINHLKLLNRFVDYFNSEAASIIEECEENRIFIKNKTINKENLDSPLLAPLKKDQAKTNNFLHSTKIKKLYINQPDFPKISLTPKEVSCLPLLAIGKSATEIGNSLFISPRTAEKHWEHIKSKLGLKRKSDLTRFLLKNDIIQSFL